MSPVPTMPQHLALQVDAVHPRPAAGADLRRVEGGVLGQREHQPEGVLGHHRSGAPRLVAHHHAAAPRGRQIDHVGADGAGGDEAQLRQALQRRRRPAYRSTGVDHELGACGALHQLRRAAGAVAVDHHLVDLGARPQPLEVVRPLDLRRVVAGNDHFHGRLRSGRGRVSVKRPPLGPLAGARRGAPGRCCAAGGLGRRPRPAAPAATLRPAVAQRSGFRGMAETWR